MKAKSPSTTVRGNAFRDDILQLIKLRPGVSNAQAERQIGTQPVDLYYEERASFGIVRVACECKAYSDPLTKTFIAEKIVPRYQPLLDRRLVDRVQIIAPKNIGAVADEYVHRELRYFSFLTNTELQADIIDFSAYISSLEGLYREGGLDRYYVRPLLSSGEDLESRLTDWLDGASSQPVAILAGYGMGKTSFARRFAYAASQRFFADKSCRIPILIPLSEIASEQRIEGLLGRLLTTDGSVVNFSYGLFSELNARGRFIIILDGFDEMKHTMSWAQFKYNFAQLNKLVVPQSRVLLLGRPSAFMSDAEHLYILAGKRPQGSQLVRVPDAPTYTEIHLQEFSPEQAIDFIKAYAAFQGPTIAAVRGESYNALLLAERLDSIRTDPHLMGLVTRPVQARMLANLAIDVSVAWRSFTRYELYSEFIRNIIEREVEKPTRSAFSYDERMEFHRALAWMIWNQQGQGSGFKLTAISPEFIRSFRRDDLFVDDDDALVRDLVSGSILERKTGDAYFFPHRSFVEFLVAEYMCTTEWNTETIGSFAEVLTSEVSDFIKEAGRESVVVGWSNLLDDARGVVSIQLLALIAWALNKSDAAPPKQAAVMESPHFILLNHLRMIEVDASPSNIVNYLGHSFYSVQSLDSKLSCIRSLAIVSNARPELRQAIWDRIAAFVLSNCIEELKRVLAAKGSADFGLQVHQPFVRLFASSFKSATSAAGEVVVEIDEQSFTNEIRRVLGHKWDVLGLDLGPHEGSTAIQPVSFQTLGTMIERLKLSNEGSVVLRFFRNHPNPRELIRIQRITTARRN